MVIEKTIKLYTYDELSEKAKDQARYWWSSVRGPEDYDFVVEDFQRVAEILGFRIGDRATNIYWSVGYCQSDFAGFDAYYSHNKGSVAAIKAYAPRDETLHAIAADLAAMQRKYRFALEAEVSYSDYYGMQVSEATVDGRYLYGEGDGDDVVKEAAKDLARWLYKRLREEDEYLSSEEAVAEAMEANEYTFREDGTREDV